MPRVNETTLPPGSTIGIMGSGQLGRMTATAAARLGYRCHVFSPEADSPAAQVSAAATVAAYDDRPALTEFAHGVDVVTFEFENVPAESVRLLADRVPVRPRWECLEISQDRVVEKDFLNRVGVATAPYRAVAGPEAVAEALADLGRPAILKTTRLGYDGKGQVRLDAGMDPAEAWRAMGGTRGIVEAFVDFEQEVSAIVARGPDGAEAAFDVVENRHVDGILDITIAPANIDPAKAAKAQAITATVAREMDLVGLLAVEMFVTGDGRLLVNELAPRPHNSGHWTIDACVTSQFEQFVRAVCGLPLGTTRRHSDAMTKNLIGAAADDWAELLANPEAKVHLYGKTEIRPGRKMGHVTWIYPRVDNVPVTPPAVA